MVKSLYTPDVLTQPIATNGTKNSIPNTNDQSLGLMSQSTGFPAICSERIADGGKAPRRADFNGLFYLLSQFGYFAQNGGSYTFNQSVSDAIGGYPLNAILWYIPDNGLPYPVKSLIENNTYNFVTTPSYIDGVHWVSTYSGFVQTTGNQTIAGNKNFTGGVQAPTPTAGSNDTNVATTAWVKAQIQSGGLTNEVAFYQNAGGNLEEVSSGVYKVPTGSSFTLASGKSFTRDDEPQIDFTGRSDGDYYVFVPESGACVAYPTTYLTISKKAPTSPLQGYIWFNPFSTPYKSKIYNGMTWTNNFPYALSNTIVTVDSSATPIVAFPLMTGDNLPAGQYASASSGVTNPPYRAFDGSIWSSWGTDPNAAVPHQLTRWADTAVTANAVYLSSSGDNEEIGSFTLKGSNDGVSWTDIQTYTDLPTQDKDSGGLTLLFPKSTYKYFQIYNAFARVGDSIRMLEVSYRLIQPYNTTDIGNRTSYTEALDITPISGVSFEVLSSVNGGGWTATSDGVLYALMGFGNTNENRIYVDGVQITQITSYGGDSNGNINSCTTVILHKGQVVTLDRPLEGALFLPARKGSME